MASTILPTFRYHPDPIGNAVIGASPEVCAACSESRGYIYTSSVYSKHELRNQLCPWCIADGTAHSKFDASFSDEDPLVRAGIDPSIVSEVCTRTPGFDSWQQEVWLSHCEDACAFLGDATIEELRQLSGSKLEQFLAEQMVKSSDWNEILEYYEPGGSPAVYAFGCLHCTERLYHMDFS